MTSFAPGVSTFFPLDALGAAVVGWFLLLNSVTALLLVRSIAELWRQWHIADDEELEHILRSEALPPVSILVTSSAGGSIDVDRMRSLLALQYPRHEVVLVHDGAAAASLQSLVDAFALYEVPPAVMVSVPTGAVRGYYRSQRFGKLFVIDKEQVGNADALNAALNASRFPYLLPLDERTWLEPDGLLRLMRPFLIGERVAAVAGTTRVANGCRLEDGRVIEVRAPADPLPGVQVLEYLRDLVFGRLAWNGWGGSVPTSGAVTLHRRDHLLEIGGYRRDVVAEELDLVVRLRHHLREQKLTDAIPLIPDVVAWTLVPDTARALASQRDRWQRGQVEVLLLHRTLLFNPREGALGMVALPHLLVSAVIAPVLEVVGYLCVALALIAGGASARFVPVFLIAALGYAALLSLWAVTLEASAGRAPRRWIDLLRLSLFVLLEQIGYRQLLVWIRLRALWRSPRGGHSGAVAAIADAEVRAAPGAGPGGASGAR